MLGIITQAITIDTIMSISLVLVLIVERFNRNDISGVNIAIITFIPPTIITKLVINKEPILFFSAENNIVGYKNSIKLILLTNRKTRNSNADAIVPIKSII